MKTGKRIFSIILVFALVLTMLPAVTFAAPISVLPPEGLITAETRSQYEQMGFDISDDYQTLTYVYPKDQISAVISGDSDEGSYTVTYRKTYKWTNVSFNGGEPEEYRYEYQGSEYIVKPAEGFKLKSVSFTQDLTSDGGSFATAIFKNRLNGINEEEEVFSTTRPTPDPSYPNGILRPDDPEGDVPYAWHDQIVITTTNLFETMLSLELRAPKEIVEGAETTFTAVVSYNEELDQSTVPEGVSLNGLQLIATLPDGTKQSVTTANADGEDGVASFIWTCPQSVFTQDELKWSVAFGGSTHLKAVTQDKTVPFESRTIATADIAWGSVGNVKSLTGKDVPAEVYTVSYAKYEDGRWEPCGDGFPSVSAGESAVVRVTIAPVNGSGWFGGVEEVVASSDAVSAEIKVENGSMSLIAPNGLYEGQEAYLEAKFSDAGTVYFYEDGSQIGSSHTLNGKAKLHFYTGSVGPTLTAGSHTYTALFVSDLYKLKGELSDFSGMEEGSVTLGAYAGYISFGSGDITGELKPGTYKTATVSATINSGKLPTSGWSIRAGEDSVLKLENIGAPVTLSIQAPTGVRPNDFTVVWYESTDGNEYHLLDSSSSYITGTNTVTVIPLANTYRYYAVVYPKLGGHYYLPKDGISIQPIVFEEATRNNTAIEMTAINNIAFERSQMVITATVYDLLSTAYDSNDAAIAALNTVPSGEGELVANKGRTVKGGQIMLTVRKGDGTDSTETKAVNEAGSATFTVIVPETDKDVVYTVKYLPETEYFVQGKPVYRSCETSRFTFLYKTNPLPTETELQPAKPAGVQAVLTDMVPNLRTDMIFKMENGNPAVVNSAPLSETYLTRASTKLFWLPPSTVEDKTTNYDRIAIWDDEKGEYVDNMAVGHHYTLVAPTVYSLWRGYADGEDGLYLYYKPLVEGRDFYYEWLISKDSGNTWEITGGRSRYLTDVAPNDNFMYKVRAIPTNNYDLASGGLYSILTPKSDRVPGTIVVSVKTNLNPVTGDGDDQYKFDKADAYERTPVTIRASYAPDYTVDHADQIASVTGTFEFWYKVSDTTDTDETDPEKDEGWIKVISDETGDYKVDSKSKNFHGDFITKDNEKYALATATITTSSLPVAEDGRAQDLIFRVLYTGDDAYADSTNFTEANEEAGMESAKWESAILRIWSSVPYVNLSSEDLVDGNPIGIVVTASEASIDENGETTGVVVEDNTGNITIEGADDLGDLYGDGSYQALTLTTPVLTRDGYTGTDDVIAQVGETDSRKAVAEVPALAVLDADTHYDIYWEYCPNYKADLVSTNGDGAIDTAIDSSAGDRNNWIAVEGSANWNSILVAPAFASYAFRARITVRDTDATKAAFTGSEAVDGYGEETTKSAARVTYYSNVILVNSGASAADNALEAVISPSSSGAKGGDTVTIDAFVYGGSTAANPEGYVELYVDTFEEDGWVKLDELEGAAFAVSDRNDDYRQALVNGEVVWNLQNIQPGIYSFKLVYQNADSTYASEKFIYNYIVRDDTYEIMLNPVEEIYDGERHAADITVIDYSEDGTVMDEKAVGEWTWNYYEYSAENSDEYIDLVQLALDNIVYYYYELGEEGYAAEPAVTAPIDHGNYKVNAVLLDTIALTRRSVSADSAVIVLKRAVYLEDVTYQTEIYDPTNLTARQVNVPYTELNQAPVTSKVENGDTGFYTYGTNSTLPSEEADVTYESNVSNPGTGIPARAGANAIGVVAGDTVFVRVISATVAEGQYVAGENRKVAIVVSLDGADAENYMLVQAGITAGAMTDDATETYENFPITIYRNQVYAGWTGTDAASFAAVDESGTTAPDMAVEVYYHGEGKIALVGTGTWTKTAGFSALTEADQWDDENGNTIVPADMSKAGLYTIVVRPQDADNYKGGASTKFAVKVSANGSITRTYEKTMDKLAAPTLIDIKDVQQIYDGTNKTVSVLLTNPSYTASNAAVEYYFDGAKVTETKEAGRYGVTVSVADKNGVTLDSPYTAAGILMVYRGEYDYAAPLVSDKIYDGEIVAVSNANVYPDGTYFTFSGGRIKGVSYDAPANAGKYVVTAHIPNTHNFAETTVTSTFVIEKKTVTAQVMNTYKERFTTIAKADVIWDGFVDGDSAFSDVLILPSFAQSSLYPTHVGPYEVKAVKASFGKEVDANRAAFAEELLDYTAYAYNYVIDTVDGTNSLIADGERVNLEILGLNGHGTIRYGDVIDLWTIGNTANYWAGGTAEGVSESSIIRWSVAPAEDFAGTVLIDAQTGRLYVAGVGEFTVTAYRGIGNDIIYTTATAVAEKYVADVVVDQEDYVYDGTAKRLSTHQDRIHIGFLDEMTVTLTQMTEVAKIDPNPEFYSKTVTLFTVRDAYIFNYSMTPDAINQMAAAGAISESEKAEYLAKYTAEDWIEVGDYLVTVYINPVTGNFYEGFGSNRLTIHESYKDVVPMDVIRTYGEGYLVGTQGDTNYTHTVDSTLSKLSGLSASGSEAVTLTDAWVFGDVNRRADVGMYDSFVAGGTESNDAIMNDSNFIYNYENGKIEVAVNPEVETFELGFSKQDGTGYTEDLKRVYGDDTYVVDYRYLDNLMTGDSLADFELDRDFAYVTAKSVSASGSKLYSRTLPARGDVVLDSTAYTGIENQNLILSNADNHAERDDNDIYTVEANDNAGGYDVSIVSNHYGEAGVENYILDLRAKNLKAENYAEYDGTLYDNESYEGYVKFTTDSLQVSQRPVALKAWRASIPYGASFKDAYDLLISCYEIQAENASNMGLAYKHEIEDLELLFYTMIGNEKVYLTESFLTTWYESENVEKSYTFIPEIGNTNYSLVAVEYVEEPDGAVDPDIEVDVTKTQIWGKVTWKAGNYAAYRYTDNFSVTFYKSVYNETTGKWVETNERVVLNDNTVEYTIRKYAEDGKGDILVEGILTNPTGASYVYSSGRYNQIFEQVQVFFKANGYNLISVK